MKKTIKIQNLKPLSINATYYGGSTGFVKTSKANKWMAEVFYQLDIKENKHALAQLRAEFDPKKHMFHIDLTAEYPAEIMYTREGLISARTHDITNWEKALVDCIFLKKHFGKEVPFGCHNLNTDDKFITQMVSRKRASEDGQYRLLVELELLEFQVVDDVD